MVGLGDLPPDCIARILSQVLTTPLDAGRCATFSRAFRSASDSNDVWLNFPPPDLDSIVSDVLPPPFGPSRTRKNVFLRLCTDPILIDPGHKSFALEKWSGKKCYMIGARGLSIKLGDTPICWRQSSLGVSRFPEVAAVAGVHSLEVRARIETQRLSADTYYSAYFIIEFAHGISGFQNQAVGASIFSGTEVRRRRIYLDPDGRRRQSSTEENVRSTEKNIPRDRGDGWKEICLGKFFVSNPPTGQVKIRLKKLTSDRWKSGLVIQGIELRPTRIISR